MLASSSRRNIVLAAVLALSASAYAQQPGLDSGARSGPRESVPQASGPKSEPVMAPAPALLSGDIADDALLEQSRGGDSRTIIDTKFTGTVNGNSATNVSTGWNVIQGNSFANMTGIPVVIQNSGANVLIQNATVINLQMQ